MVTAKSPRKVAGPAKVVKKPLEPQTPASKTAASKLAATAAPSKLPAQIDPAVHAKAKNKLVRDSFTIPKAEYVVLQGLKLRATSLKHTIKKSELLRAGVAALQAMSDQAFLAALGAVPSLKTGRPKV